uniref:Phostensin/Taperin PP1-binding domain-containing protein n=1 Tax=Pygocentrus nattereri TaxID=42514 RepID=A0AAR2JLX8_PYGNA
MSVSVLPEWKQLLLERKRREEEERERREREEEERLASMPAWKRGIIQRRRAKQEGGGERRESEREGGQHSCLDRNSDGPCDDRLMFRQTDNENETASKTHNQVSVETIGPIRQNPFIRSQNSYRRDNRRRETEKENHGREKERESIYEKTGGDENTGEKEKDIEEEESQGQERDFWRGRDREMRIERTRDRSEGRERVGREVLKDREKDASWKAGRPLTRVESLRERIRQREMERQRRGEAEGEGEGERETGRSEGEGMERGEMRREAEGALRAVMVNRQEVASPQTLSMFDVTKEASVSKASPQLPASVPLSLSQSLSAGREAPKLSGNSQCFSEQNEEDFGSQQDPDSLTVAPPEEGEAEEDLFEEENVHSPENLQKPLERAIAPSSPLSPSSVSISPSVTSSSSQPSPLFSIRSASGGPGKRGTTITITPRRPAAGISALPAPSVSPSTPPTPAPEPDTGEGHKKRYPTAEEIEVIGGYQNLENSCLVKNRGTPKGVRMKKELYFLQLGYKLCLSKCKAFQTVLYTNEHVLCCWRFYTPTYLAIKGIFLQQEVTGRYSRSSVFVVATWICILKLLRLGELI